MKTEKEHESVKKELSALMEITLRLEDELFETIISRGSRNQI